MPERRKKRPQSGGGADEGPEHAKRPPRPVPHRASPTKPRVGKAAPKIPSQAARRSRSPAAATARAQGSARGRPPGVRLPIGQELEDMLEYIRAGGYPWVAAQRRGIAPRTFNEWMARGRGEHPTRSRTAALARFAAAVDQADAIGRLGAEIRLYRDHPERWLRYRARSAPGREGWSDPVSDSAPRSAPSAPAPTRQGAERGLSTPEEAAEVFEILREAGVFDADIDARAKEINRDKDKDKESEA